MFSWSRKYYNMNIFIANTSFNFRWHKYCFIISYQFSAMKNRKMLAHTKTYENYMKNFNKWILIFFISNYHTLTAACRLSLDLKRGHVLNINILLRFLTCQFHPSSGKKHNINTSSNYFDVFLSTTLQLGNNKQKNNNGCNLD